MALQKQTVRMSIVDGLDTKTDEKNVIPTRFLEADNVVYTRTGSVSKRYGYVPKPTNIYPTSSINVAGAALSTFKNELLQYNNGNLYTYGEGVSKWSNKGAYPSVAISEKVIKSQDTYLGNPDIAVGNGIKCIVYNSVAQFRDAATDSILSEINLGGDVAKVNFFNNNFVVTYTANNGGWRVYTSWISASDVSTIAGTLLLYIEPFGTGALLYLDTAISNNVLGVTFYASDENRIFCVGVSSSFTKLFQSVAWDNAAGEVTYFPSINAENNKFRIIYTRKQVSGIPSFETVLVTTSGSVSSNYTIAGYTSLTVTSAYPGIARAVGNTSPSDSTKTIVFAEYVIAESTTGGACLDTFALSGNNTVSAVSTIAHGYHIISKAINVGGTLQFCVTPRKYVRSAASSFVRTDSAYLMDAAGNIKARAFVDSVVYNDDGTLGGVDYKQLPAMVSVNGKYATVAVLVNDVVTAQTAFNGNTVNTKISEVDFDFSTAANFFDVEMLNNLHTSGSITMMYDGQQIVEHNFLQAPQTCSMPTTTSATLIQNSDATLTASINTTSGITTTGGSYSYAAVWSWTDSQGNLHRSYPTFLPPIALTATSGSNKWQVAINIQPLQPTFKSTVVLEIYRTELNGTTYYKTSGLSGYARNTNFKNYPYITVIDATPDATLISKETLYNTGGILENEAALPNVFMAPYKGRIFTILSDRKTLQYSKANGQGEPVEFNSALTVQLDQYGGDAVALGVIDDNLIVLKEEAIFVENGEGPLNTGEQNDYRRPALITTDVGCNNPNSVVRTPDGLMFSTNKGIYLLNRSMTVNYIGAPVEVYKNLNITSATLLESTNQVRFTTAEGTALVYDYLHRRWATFSNILAADAVMYSGMFTYLRNNTAETWVETKDVYTDNGAFIPMKLTSAWIAFGGNSSTGDMVQGIQGFERFYKMLLLGTYKSTCNFKVSMGYDYDINYTTSVTVTAGSILGTPVTTSLESSAGSLYIESDPLFQWRIFPKRQKCEAFRFKIEDINSGVPGESFSLSNFAAEIGLKPALYKKGTGNSAGTT